MPKSGRLQAARYVTSADFVKDRFGQQDAALAVAITGIIATMPYIALQMFGIQVSLAASGIPLSVSPGCGLIFPYDRLHHPGSLHLHQWPARTSNDRPGEGHHDLYLR